MRNDLDAVRGRFLLNEAREEARSIAARGDWGWVEDFSAAQREREAARSRELGARWRAQVPPPRPGTPDGGF